MIPLQLFEWAPIPPHVPKPSTLLALCSIFSELSYFPSLLSEQPLHLVAPNRTWLLPADMTSVDLSRGGCSVSHAAGGGAGVSQSPSPFPGLCSIALLLPSPLSQRHTQWDLLSPPNRCHSLTAVIHPAVIFETLNLANVGSDFKIQTWPAWQSGLLVLISPISNDLSFSPFQPPVLWSHPDFVFIHNCSAADVADLNILLSDHTCPFFSCPSPHDCSVPGFGFSVHWRSPHAPLPQFLPAHQPLHPSFFHILRAYPPKIPRPIMSVTPLPVLCTPKKYHTMLAECYLGTYLPFCL